MASLLSSTSISGPSTSLYLSGTVDEGRTKMQFFKTQNGLFQKDREPEQKARESRLSKILKLWKNNKRNKAMKNKTME